MSKGIAHMHLRILLRHPNPQVGRDGLQINLRHCGCTTTSHGRQHVVELIVAPIIVLLLLWGSEPPLGCRLGGYLHLARLEDFHWWRRLWRLVLVELIGRLHGAPDAHAEAAATATGSRAPVEGGAHPSIPVVCDGRDRAHGAAHARAAWTIGGATVLSLLQPLQLPQVSGVVIVLLLHLLADGDEVPDALDVIRVRLVDLLVQLQRLRVGAHAAVARRNHQPPLHLRRLNLSSSAKERNGGFVHLLFHVIDSQPSDHVHVDRPIPVRLEVVMECLSLIAGLVEEIGKPGKDAWVCRPTLG
mmetsp:Transcript_69034/g.173964  ORF Transcript_69034/g.173964 Transcript_69034/m.173964 type:complete len:301 (-) Transcript_69034:1861-2763(-)